MKTLNHLGCLTDIWKSDSVVIDLSHKIFRISIDSGHKMYHLNVWAKNSCQALELACDMINYSSCEAGYHINAGLVAYDVKEIS